jgi:hypothetical protein
MEELGGDILELRSDNTVEKNIQKDHWKNIQKDHEIVRISEGTESKSTYVRNLEKQ